MSHPARGAWIETRTKERIITILRRSHPARGAWIETMNREDGYKVVYVAPRPGCVD